MNRLIRIFWLAFSTLFLGFMASANAAEQAFEQQTFEHVLKSGKPLIVEFYANWCPVCRAQKPVVAALLKEDKLKGITLLVADFDNSDALKRTLRVSQQSTFVVFKQGKEVGRSTGQTRREELETLFKRAL